MGSNIRNGIFTQFFCLIIFANFLSHLEVSRFRIEFSFLSKDFDILDIRPFGSSQCATCSEFQSWTSSTIWIRSSQSTFGCPMGLWLCFLGPQLNLMKDFFIRSRILIIGSLRTLEKSEGLVLKFLLVVSTNLLVSLTNAVTASTAAGVESFSFLGSIFVEI